MMNNGNEDRVNDKKNDVFINQPDFHQAEEASATTLQTTCLSNTNINGNLRHSTSLLDHYQVQPFPFTFIAAVKRKLALTAQLDSYKQVSKTNNDAEADKLTSDNIDSASTDQSLYNQVEKMDFIKPLKAPDSKISSKNPDFSPRISPLPRSVTTKSDKSSKISEKAYRKLDFSQGSSFITSDDLKALKIPNVSFGLSSSKKKEHSRDNSREKENRTKRVKKDELVFTKNEEIAQDMAKKVKNLKHIPRKDIDDTIVKSGKSERLRESDSIAGKSKSKNFPVSTARKDDERKQRPTSLHCQKSLRDRSLERKGKSYSSESLCDRNIKIHDYAVGRENSWTLDHAKKPTDKSSKPSTSKIHHRLSVNTPEICEEMDIDCQQLKNKIDRVSQTSQSSSHSDNFRYIEGFRKKDTAQNVCTTEAKSTSDTKLDTTDSIDELLNSRKISFRDDSYSQQEDFCNLVTPNLNLIYRPKRKKDQRPIQLLQETDIDGKYKAPASNDAQTADNTPLLHPTALHMQFQAELHLLDSYNESIRQVTDVENTLYNVKQDQEREKLQKLSIEAAKSADDLIYKASSNGKISDVVVDADKNTEGRHDDEIDARKVVKVPVKVVEVQTQTANDIATQTETSLVPRHNVDSRLKEFSGITYQRGGSFSDLPQLSLGSIDEFKDLDQLDEISLANKMRAMSEISMHETTSSIKTETGTEISISTRDVTCSFNKYLDLEMAQLIKDEKLMYDKIEMLFKSREKTLNDRSRKLVKLEEQKRALRDTGQDSRISSVKKKQRALLLKLQQEKDEMNRLKELHKMASQERKVMLQKQRNMFNPQMSTKNILTKLKRTADCQSPRRLSGPMKGYDIRSNSSISSHVDSDKSQLDRSHLDGGNRGGISDSGSNKIKGLNCNVETGSSVSGINSKYPNLLEESSNLSNSESPQKYEVHTRNFEEKMPKGADLLRLKTHQMKLQTKLLQARHGNVAKLTAQDSQDGKSESDTLVEELSKKSKILRDRGEGLIDENMQKKKVEKSTDVGKKSGYNGEIKATSKRKNAKSIKPKMSSVLQENILRAKSNLNSSDDILKHNRRPVDTDAPSEDNFHDSILEEISFNDSQNSLQALVKHSKTVKEKNYHLLHDIMNNHEAKENIAGNRMDRDVYHASRDDTDVQNLGNISTRSQVSTFTISHHSSGDSEQSYSRSVVIRSQDHQFKSPKKLEQVLHAREARLATRRNCVEDLIAWHTRLKAEESRIARMEEAAFKLVTATSNALSCHDTTASSDTSDVEGRLELLTEKLSERRVEMAKLKREARRQAKQRLKALEANLLNQIKKYDLTIYEMKKKLEAKRSISKDDGKLAIEAKSIADFKVPEIPIKRIQDIYKNSDLLRSRSDSDLIVNGQQSDVKKIHSLSSEFQSTSTLASKNSSLKGSPTEKTASRSIESVFDEIKSRSSHRSSNTSKSEINSSIHSSSKSSNTQIRTDEQVPTVSPTSKMTVEKSPEILSTVGTVFSTKFDILDLNNKNLSEDINTLENDLKTLSEMMSRFSKKSGDKSRSIYNNSQSENERSTSRDISEDLPKSENIETVEESTNIVEDLISPSKASSIHSETFLPSSDLHSEVPEKLPDSKLSDEIDFEARSKEILNVIEKSIISEHIKLPRNNFDLTGAALEKSMQNLHKENEALSSDFNSLEGDIKTISEIISKMVENKRSHSIATDPTIYDYDDSSKVQEEIKSLNYQPINTNNTIEEEINSKTASESQILEKSHNNSHESPKNLHLTSTQDHEKSPNATEIIEEIDISLGENISPAEIVESNYSACDYSTKEDNFSADANSLPQNDWSALQSVEPSQKNEEILEKSSPEVENHDQSQIKENFHLDESQISINHVDFPNYTVDASIFTPAGESTNIHDAYNLSGLEETAIDETLNYQRIHTDELDDILDIIARESRETNSSASAVDLGQVPEALALEIRDKSMTPLSNELNLTAEVEPVLQKLTEILQSVERNIAKRTQSKKISESSEETDQIPSLDDQTSLSRTLNVENGGENLACEKNKVNMIGNETEKICKLNFKRPEVLKDPEYEDISEESLEVSEILDKSESQRCKKKTDKFEAIEKTDDVLRILDQISQQSCLKVTSQSNNADDHLQDLEITIQVFGSLSPGDVNNRESGVVIEELEESESLQQQIDEPSEILKGKIEEASSESSEDAADTPRGVSEIDMDSPRDADESRLDIEILDDDLLAGSGVDTNAKVLKLDFPSATSIVTSEKDIEAMIAKLRASLEQPGVEVSEMDARVLQLEQLQIELQIKKLEAEEEAFYVREIPNKPPPPYTPPGGGSRSSPESSPTLPPAVVPTNVEELTAFTEKATIIIYNAKLEGKDVMSLEVPTEICQFSKDSNEIAKKDRRIYNTFLFDLCKETIAEVYQSEYEKPGPSWTKPNVKTKPSIKIPKTVDELNEYVSKEVATLFGFKTKLQRENMVMRWSRKRRDRVDELLAREAQAEENEWTKFHHDELAVKNELTVAILETLISETANIIKSAFTKKQRIIA